MPSPDRSKRQVIGSTSDQIFRALAMVRRSFRHLPKGAIVCAVGLVVSLGAALTMQRLYRSEAVVLYRQAIDPTVIANVGEEHRDNVREIGARLEELLKARRRLRTMIDKYKLYPKVIERRGYVEAVDLMRSKIDFRIGQGDTFHVAYFAATPQLAQQVTSELASSLIQQATSLRQEQAEATERFLSSETKRLQQALDRRQQGLAEFLGQNPEFAQEVQPEAAGASIRAMRHRKKKSGSDALSVLERQAARIRAQLSAKVIVPKRQTDPRLEAAVDRAMEELREARMALSRKRAQYTEKHPDVVTARQRLARAQDAVTRTTRAVRASQLGTPRKLDEAGKQELKQRLEAIQRQVASLRRARGAKPSAASISRQATDRIVALETQWQRLNREVRQARDAYVKLEERLFRARLNASSEVATEDSHLRVIDPAFEPTRPAGVGRTMVVLGGMAASAFFAAMLMLGLALIDQRIYDRIDVERVGLASVLVEVPRVRRRGGVLRRTTGRRGRRG